MKYIISAFNFLMAFVMMFALCSLDSESWIPLIVFAVSGLYLTAVAYINERRYAEEEE